MGILISLNIFLDKMLHQTLTVKNVSQCHFSKKIIRFHTLVGVHNENVPPTTTLNQFDNKLIKLLELSTHSYYIG